MGLNAEQRTRLDLPQGLTQNTWAFGLRRLLLGYTVGSAEAWQGIEPFDDIGGLEASLAGPLAILLEKLENTWETFCQPTDAATWVARLRELLETYFLTDDAQESVMLTKLETALQQLLDSTEEAQLLIPYRFPWCANTGWGKSTSIAFPSAFWPGQSTSPR
ncbi:hypothetical protein HSBAA_44630 [Vreelandella sulfidaeris]|uniref:RecC C-terminal domain-containing protein n=1 Tax=Vreelandella sulfidaeris TaxID=115553 RepID=A0A455UC22_9GAMM|nr:hypothetical protein HSBAA_44630 [Halomonas sulfidaeris]